MANSFKLHERHLDFLTWLVNSFGTNVRYISYINLGKEANLSNETVRSYMFILEKYGYLTIDKLSTKKRAFRITQPNEKA
jgi:transcriptional regulator of heat shock response